MYAARDDFSSPGHREPTRNNEEKFIQSPLPSESLPNFHVLSDHGLLGSGSTNPKLGSKNVRICRPPL
ncbi:hypothetical protein MKX01_028799 [Papaver californicum]|nr:hypothetical protein MKX01_028799 [Papaver californicum]